MDYNALKFTWITPSIELLYLINLLVLEWLHIMYLQAFMTGRVLRAWLHCICYICLISARQYLGWFISFDKLFRFRLQLWAFSCIISTLGCASYSANAALHILLRMLRLILPRKGSWVSPTACLITYFHHKIFMQVWPPLDSYEVYTLLWWFRLPWLPSLCRWPKPKQFCFSFHLLWLHLWDRQGDSRIQLTSLGLFFIVPDLVYFNTIILLCFSSIGIPLSEEGPPAGNWSIFFLGLFHLACTEMVFGTILKKIA